VQGSHFYVFIFFAHACFYTTCSIVVLYFAT